MIGSPSRFDVAQWGCPDLLQAYLLKEETWPDEPLSNGLAFHRAAEAIQRGLLAGGDADALIDQAMAEAGRTPDLVDCLERWRSGGWANVDKVVGIEIGVAVDKAGNEVPWESPSAWVRGIIDRAEMGRVIDWKGWKGWKRLQPEVYAILAFAHWPEWESVEVIPWSYRPTVDRSIIVKRDELPALLVEVGEAVRSLEALATIPSGQRPGGGCAWCPRRLACPALVGVTEAPPTTQEEADALADRVLGLLGAAKAGEVMLKAWGGAAGTGRRFGPHVATERRVDAGAFWRGVLGEVPVEVLEGRLPQLAKVGASIADGAARGMRRGDKAAQAELLAAWTQTVEVRRVGWFSGDEDEEEEG